MLIGHTDERNPDLGQSNTFIHHLDVPRDHSGGAPTFFS